MLNAFYTSMHTDWGLQKISGKFEQRDKDKFSMNF